MDRCCPICRGPGEFANDLPTNHEQPYERLLTPEQIQCEKFHRWQATRVEQETGRDGVQVAVPTRQVPMDPIHTNYQPYNLTNTPNHSPTRLATEPPEDVGRVPSPNANSLDDDGFNDWFDWEAFRATCPDEYQTYYGEMQGVQHGGVQSVQHGGVLDVRYPSIKLGGAYIQHGEGEFGVLHGGEYSVQDGREHDVLHGVRDGRVGVGHGTFSAVGGKSGKGREGSSRRGGNN